MKTADPGEVFLSFNSSSTKPGISNLAPELPGVRHAYSASQSHSCCL